MSSRTEAAQSIMDQVDMLAEGLVDPRVELKPITVQVPSGAKVVVLVVTEEAWISLQELLRENGGYPIPHYLN